MLDCREIMRFKFVEQRIGDSKVRIMYAQMFFENLPAPLHFLEALAGCGCAAIVSPKIDKRLFALKYGRRSESCRPGPISSEIGAVAASR